MATILLIDDEDQVRRLCQTVLEAGGHRVLPADGGRHGLQVSDQQDLDLALVDMFMSGMDGLEVIEQLHLTQPKCKIIVMSGGSSREDVFKAAMQVGAHAMLKKPFELQELLDAVSEQLMGERF